MSSRDSALAGEEKQGRRGRRRCVEEGGSASEGWWSPGGAGRLGGAPTAARSQPMAGKNWRRRPAKLPSWLEVGDDWVGCFANSEKFRGLIVK